MMTFATQTRIVRGHGLLAVFLLALLALAFLYACDASDATPNKAAPSLQEKPEPPSSPPVPAAPTKQALAPTAAKADSAPAEPEAKATVAPQTAETSNAAKGAGRASDSTNPAYAKIVQEHGDSAVLRPKLFRPVDGKRKKLDLHEADWAHPLELSFVQLIKNYQYYRVNDKFHPKGVAGVHGGAVILTGAVMPIEPPGPNGELQRFWLANPTVVMAGCVFCNPPTLGDLVYVEVKGDPIRVDRERLYASVLVHRLLGRFYAGETKTKDGVSYIYSMELKKILD